MNMLRLFIVSLFCVILSVTAWSGDILTTTGAKYDGVFEGFSGNAFVFRATKRHNNLKEHVSRVKTLELASPAKVTYILNGGKKPEEAVLKGFEKSTFIFEKDGEEIKMPATKLREIKMPFFDPDRLEAQMVETSKIISRGEEVDIEPLLAKGNVTLVHVHSDEAPMSVKLCGYVDKLGTDSRGKITVLRASVPMGACPFSQQYKIASIPQFWFYNGKGELVKTITELFNPGQFDAALKEARR